MVGLVELQFVASAQSQTEPFLCLAATLLNRFSSQVVFKGKLALPPELLAALNAKQEGGVAFSLKLKLAADS